MSHQCTALVLSCMDFRMHQPLHDWMSGEYQSFDVVHLAGGARTLLQAETAELIIGQIELSARLHGITTVVIVNHWDCGAYGGSDAFDHDKTKERDQYTKDLTAAADILRAKFSQLSIVPVLEKLDGSIEKIS